VRNIGLIGKARSGKDTAANALVRERSYTRLAFADPLKAMVLGTDPFVPTGWGLSVRLQALIADVGWEYAKDTYPEVRRLLQRTGQAVRELDDDFWLAAMRKKLNAAESWNLPVVVTDVRYPNEADMLRSRGFTLVRIVRPTGTAKTIGEARAAMHASETALDDYRADVVLTNDGTVDALTQGVIRI
jgi:hypothetical protein